MSVDPTARGMAAKALSAGLSFNGSTVTASSPVLNTTQTWNNAGVTFTGWKFNVTDTASASGSLLVDLQVGGASKFSVTKVGAITAGSDITVGAGRLRWTGASAIYGGAADGTIMLSNSAASAFNLLQLGGTTSAFPAFKRSGTAIQARLADDSGDAPLTVSTVRTVPVTVATLPAAATAGAGARAFVTDATAPTFGATVAGAGAVSTPVYSDGSAWKVG